MTSSGTNVGWGVVGVLLVLVGFLVVLRLTGAESAPAIPVVDPPALEVPGSEPPPIVIDAPPTAPAGGNPAQPTVNPAPLLESSPAPPPDASAQRSWKIPTVE